MSAVAFRRVDRDNAALLDHVADGVFNDPIEEQWRDAYFCGGGSLLVVAIDSGLVVGQVKSAIHFHPDKPPDLYIDELVVAPTHQRRGIARRLLGEIERWARERGCVDVWLAAEVGNDAARSLYGSFAESKPALLYYWDL